MKFLMTDGQGDEYRFSSIEMEDFDPDNNLYFMTADHDATIWMDYEIRPAVLLNCYLVTYITEYYDDDYNPGMRNIIISISPYPKSSVLRWSRITYDQGEITFDMTDRYSREYHFNSIEFEGFDLSANPYFTSTEELIEYEIRPEVLSKWFIVSYFNEDRDGDIKKIIVGMEEFEGEFE